MDMQQRFKPAEAAFIAGAILFGMDVEDPEFFEEVLDKYRGIAIELSQEPDNTLGHIKRQATVMTGQLELEIEHVNRA